MANQDHANKELESINLMLQAAIVPSFDDSGEQVGMIDLTCECIWSALNYMKSNPNPSIQDACEFALDEWIK